MHLPKVCRNLGLLVAPTSYVLMRVDYFAPRRENSRRLALNGSAGSPAPL